jgi:ubiquinol-cytochrome c reductase iron-sulfur subunit
MATTEQGTIPAHEGDGIRRRDFIYVAATAFAGVGAGVAAWPLVNQMNPSADVLALASVEVDVSKVERGQAIKVSWRGKPVFVRNLTDQEMSAAESVPLAELRDPAPLEQRTQEGHRNWLVTIGVCTHLGCVPLGAAEGEPRGDYNGYFCPCHGSHYDPAGRIRKGPAPVNLVVPEYVFKSDTVIEIG